MRQFIAFTVALLSAPPGGAETACTVHRQEVFAPQSKTVALVSKSGAPADAQFVVFQTKLRVNTDGAPNSYHPLDPEGRSKAINNIANGVSVRHDGRSVSYADTIQVFGQEDDISIITLTRSASVAGKVPQVGPIEAALGV